MSDKDSNPMPTPAPAPLPPPPADDAGSLALADALRSSFFIVKIIMVGLVIVFLGSGFFTVGPQQKAIILRLGSPVGIGQDALRGPGFHFAFPRPIDEVVMIPFFGIQRVDSTVGSAVSIEDRMKNVEPYDLPSLDPRSISYALTADTNIVHVEGTLRYSVTDPIQFHFDFADSAAFVTNALNNALLFACTQFNVDDLLTAKVGAFHDAVVRRLQQLIDQQQLGVSIAQVDVRATAPQHLKPKFEGVNKAIADREKTRDQSITYATNKLTQAFADAQARINEAETARRGLVGTVSADAKNFALLRSDYERDPQMFKTVLLMPALQKVLASAKEITAEPHQNGRQIRLHVSGQPVPPPAQTNQF